jgi:hypothetical protein
MKDLLKAKGILQDDKQSTNILQPKICPSCKESNRPDASFCFKCNFVMSFEAYQKGMEERGRKDHEINELKEQMNEMNVVMNNLANGFKKYKEEVKLYREEYGGRSLTDRERKRVEEFQEQMKTLSDNDNSED